MFCFEIAVGQGGWGWRQRLWRSGAWFLYTSSHAYVIIYSLCIIMKRLLISNITRWTADWTRMWVWCHLSLRAGCLHLMGGENLWKPAIAMREMYSSWVGVPLLKTSTSLRATVPPHKWEEFKSHSPLQVVFLHLASGNRTLKGQYRITRSILILWVRGPLLMASHLIKKKD